MQQPKLHASSIVSLGLKAFDTALEKSHGTFPLHQRRQPEASIWFLDDMLLLVLVNLEPEMICFPSFNCSS